MLVPVEPAPAGAFEVQRVVARDPPLRMNNDASIGGFDPIAPVSQAPLGMRDERQHSQKPQREKFVPCSRVHRLDEIERV